MNNTGRLNTDEMIGFFDLKAIEKRLKTLVEGKAIKITHSLYGELVIQLNQQRNSLSILSKDNIEAKAEQFILWGYGHTWEEVDFDYFQKQQKILFLKKELAKLEGC